MENFSISPFSPIFSRDCGKDAPFVYRTIMHVFHLWTFPVYTATLAVLYREPSKAFRIYKYYIIVHVLNNIITEVYVCYFMLPDTNLPHPLLRTTGWMARWGFSGLLQFYMLAQLVILTGLSIVEMFYYRFKICVFHYQTQKFAKIIWMKVTAYRVLVFLNPILIAIFFKKSLVEEEEARIKLYTEHPFSPPEITCYSVMLAVSGSYILWIMIVLYIVLTVLCCSCALETLVYITSYIKKSMVMSKTTERLQKMLIVSLFIQTGIHGLLILAPILFMFYAFFFEFSYDSFAYFTLIVFAYHGFVSTCGMILFTKPLRDKILPCFKKFGRTEPISTVQPSTTMDNQN